MTKKGRKLPVIYPDSVRPPPTLPEAASVIAMDLPLSAPEIMVIRMAMAIHSAARQPKLLWSGWRHIAVAVAIGGDHARKAAKGQTDTPLYIRKMSEFLNKTGFVFINKNDRAAAVRMIPHWDDIDAWRSSLPHARQGKLNNPREVWDAYIEHRRVLGDPEAKLRPAGGAHLKKPSHLEQMEALEMQVLLANDRAERAEREAAYFAAMMDEVARAGKLDEDDVAAIRARVRAQHEHEAD